jgi:Bacteriophage Sf6, terminase small subunit-like
MTHMKNDQSKASKPVDYTAEIGAAICDRIADGESPSAIWADPGMPDEATVAHWRARHEKFREEYKLAIEFQAHDLIDQMIEIADDSSGDWVERVRSDGKVAVVFDPDNLARCRLRIEILEWRLAQLGPEDLVRFKDMMDPSKE